MIDRAVARDGEKPGTERALARLERLNAIPDAQERLLHQIFRDRGVAHDREDHRKGELCRSDRTDRPWLAGPAAASACELFVGLAAQLERQKYPGSSSRLL